MKLNQQEKSEFQQYLQVHCGLKSGTSKVYSNVLGRPDDKMYATSLKHYEAFLAHRTSIKTTIPVQPKPKSRGMAKELIAIIAHINDMDVSDSCKTKVIKVLLKELRGNL